MSSESAARPRKIPCWNHEGPNPPLAEPAIVIIRFPGGEIPAEGFRCPDCGEEVLTPEQVDAARLLADRLGVREPDLRSSRSAIKLGNSTAMTFDREIARRAGIAPGTELEVGLLGDRIVVRARGPAKKPRAKKAKPRRR